MGKVIGWVGGRVGSELRCWIQHGLMGRLAGGQCMLLNGSECHCSQHISTSLVIKSNMIAH